MMRPQERQMALAITDADHLNILFRIILLGQLHAQGSTSQTCQGQSRYKLNKRSCKAVVSSFMRMADQQWPSSNLSCSGELRKPVCQGHLLGLDGFFSISSVSVDAHAATVVLEQSLEPLGRQLDQSSVQWMHRSVVRRTRDFLTRSVVVKHLTY